MEEKDASFLKLVKMGLEDINLSIETCKEMEGRFQRTDNGHYRDQMVRIRLTLERFLKHESRFYEDLQREIAEKEEKQKD